MNNFDHLLQSISEVHQHLQGHANRAVNQALTIRNLVIGMYVVEFEQNGADRAKYGDRLLAKLAKILKIKGLTAPELSRCRQFFNVYSQILGTLSQEFSQFLPERIFGTLSQELYSGVSPDNLLQISGQQLLAKLSYSHFIELIKIEDQLKRSFYEIECIKGTWSIRELRRQIGSLYFERSGLSSNPEKLSQITQGKINPQAPSDIIKNVYAFDFLAIKSHEALEESDLETALLDHLQEFIMELGYGFCLEGRQKRILIGKSYYFVDLCFYHRILKCHVLIELKVGAFTHQHIGQLNTYLNYFKAEVCEPNDNPPVGILLVAEKDHALVQYATANMDENLFVQEYLVNLPSVDELKRYIDQALKRL